VGHNAIPITTDEFALAQRDFPIVFSAGDNPVPLALMGLNDGINTFFDDEGAAREDFYVPAYIRRYPFLLARLDPKADQMSLCFDPTSDVVGPFEDGNALFDGDQASQHTQELLKFAESFEEAGARTQAFVEELKKFDLIMDGEVTIQQNDKPDFPYIYRGFQMVNQDKLREMRGDQLRKWNEIGLLPLIYAHLFSLDRMRVIFARQTQQGKGPGVEGSDAQKAALANASTANA
jgi:hypothetical protein